MSGARWGIVGGGMLGAALALRLAEQGNDVVLHEAAPRLGGLASAWQVGDVVWDRFYHVTLRSDAHTRALLAELDLESTMEWRETRSSFYAGGRLYPWSDTVDFLKFGALSTLDKLRIGATIFACSRMRDWQPLEQIPVTEWLGRRCGRRALERFWVPLLQAKLGSAYQEASAAFIWATVQRLYAARRSGLKRELFGYVPGGYARILERLSQHLAEAGVDVRVDAVAERVERLGDELVVTFRSGLVERYDHVAMTTPASVTADVVRGLTEAEVERLRAVRYVGIVCPSLVLRKPLGDAYLTYITDPAPFTAVVEMSAFVDRREFGSRSLVYLPKYTLASDPAFALDDEEVEATFLEALERMHPRFSRDDVLAVRVARSRQVFAVPGLGYSRTAPPAETSIEGLHVVCSAQIVNGTLNVNETLQLAERAAQRFALIADTAARTGDGARRLADDRADLVLRNLRGDRPVSSGDGGGAKGTDGDGDGEAQLRRWRRRYLAGGRRALRSEPPADDDLPADDRLQVEGGRTGS